MSVIKYIGRTTDFKGKPLWELLGNLKNFGIGRVVVRSMWERYPEKSFMRIIKAEPLAAPVKESMDDVRKMKVWVEKVFRGKQFVKPILIDSTSYKTDYRLLSKKEEKDYCQVLYKEGDDSKVTIIAPEMDLPPLLKELIARETGKTDVKMPVKMGYSKNKNHRIARPGETPNFEIPMNIGKPKSPSLYEGLEI